MTGDITWQIPPSMLALLGRVPADRPVALLLRHSVRDHLPPGDAGYTLPITDVGRKLALELGGMLSSRLRSLHASPLLRCVQTAEALAEGAGVDPSVDRDRLLGDPGVFVVDDRRAWVNWQKLGHEGLMSQLVSTDAALPGMARPGEAARFLVRHMLAAAGDNAGIHVFCTHDSLVTATAARILDRPLTKADWPWYLEGAFFWQSGDTVHAAYREYADFSDLSPTGSFQEEDVIELARREIAATVGLDADARFFLAGGAFKTLLTGRPPRDLDLWAPSQRDRGALVRALEQRGALPLPERPYSSAFQIDGRVVELPHKVEPPTLDERLGRFDIALSAVGVEREPGDNWTVRIHPLALESVLRRECSCVLVPRESDQ